MKEGWTYKKLGEVCDTINGLWKGKKPPYVNVGVIRNANFTKEFTIRYDNIEYLDVEEKQYSKRKLQKGDLIIEKSGGGEKQPVGRAVLFEKKDGEYSFSNFTSVLRIKNNEELLSKFLYTYLLFIYKRGDTLSMQRATTGIHNIEFDKYLSIDIPCLPLSEQQRIVSRLDSAFAHIDELKANAEKQLSEARTLFQKALTKAMEPKEGWEEKTLGKIAKVFSGYAFKSGIFQKEGKYQVIRIGNIKQNSLKLSDNAIFIDDIDSGLLQKSLLKEGDLVVTQTGTRHKRDYGFVAMVDKNNLLLNQRNACIRFDNKLSAQFFLYYSYTELYKDSFFANEGGTVGQGNVGLSALKEMIYYAPPLSEQQRIVSRLDSLSAHVHELEEVTQKTIAECDALKQALLRKVFE